MSCRHCKKRVANSARGLCRYCYRDHAIRERYPQLRKTITRTHEQTEAELDLLIEERRRELPPWWERSPGWIDTHPD